MAKEIHFYMDFPFDPVHTFKTYDGTKYAIEKGREIINTTSIANISFDLLDLGYRIFVHRNGRVLECKLGSMDGTEKEIRRGHNLLRLILGHTFDEYFEKGK
jgi:hypothetical protein